ncbi:hypothetical protein [Streptomyces syringium]|uniref:hypothetical protein n=1 Tax=Streptomyces syringium TaxID=76729 RepID=UPI003431E340
MCFDSGLPPAGIPPNLDPGGADVFGPALDGQVIEEEVQAGHALPGIEDDQEGGIAGLPLLGRAQSLEQGKP